MSVPVAKGEIWVQEDFINLNGVPRLQTDDPKFKKLQSYLDSYGTLKKREDLPEFERLAKELGLEFIYKGETTQTSFETLRRAVTTDFEVKAPFFDSKSLYKFQHVGCNLAYQILTEGEFPRFLVNWDTGTGKTSMSALISQKLYAEDLVDLVLVFCKRTKVVDWANDFKENTSLSVQSVHSEQFREDRHKAYEQWSSQVLVTNYEKARYPSEKKDRKTKKVELDWGRTDLYELLTLVQGKRILVIIDEAQKINTDNTLLSKGFNSLLNGTIQSLSPERCGVLALTATPYTTSPLNYRNIFSVLIPDLPGVSLSEQDFKEEYAIEIEPDDPWSGMYGRVKRWDTKKLHLLGKRHEIYTHAVSKSEPEIAKQFPETIENRLLLELSDHDREVYQYAQKLIGDYYEESWGFQTMFGYLNLLRMICNTTEGLKASESPISQKIVEKFGNSLHTRYSNKYQVLHEFLETRVENHEKTVLFTFWTNGTLFPYYKAIKRRFGSLPVYQIYGEGMSDQEFNSTIQKFNRDIEGSILISSDVGQEGLNLYAPYLAHIELPTMYSVYKQRSDRNHRADSKDKGIDHTWVYSFVTQDTVEEQVEGRVIKRKREAQHISGLKDNRGIVDHKLTTLDVREMLGLR